MERVLIVEDDRKTAASLELYLRAAGYQVAVAHDGATGLQRAETGDYQIVLLDLMLPGMYGMDVCRRLRGRSSVPVVMLSARATEDDQVRGLELGADDYITKPFSPRQVVARIRSVLRRFGGGDVVRLGPLELDCRSLRVAIDGQSVAVTHTEARVLRALMEAKGRALSRDEILDRAFDGRPDCADRTVDAHVKNLRRKLADRSASIVTIFGVGYRMDMTAEWPG